MLLHDRALSSFMRQNPAAMQQLMSGPHSSTTTQHTAATLGFISALVNRRRKLTRA